MIDNQQIKLCTKTKKKKSNKKYDSIWRLEYSFLVPNEIKFCTVNILSSLVNERNGFYLHKDKKIVFLQSKFITITGLLLSYCTEDNIDFENFIQIKLVMNLEVNGESNKLMKDHYEKIAIPCIESWINNTLIRNCLLENVNSFDYHSSIILEFLNTNYNSNMLIYNNNSNSYKSIDDYKEKFNLKQLYKFMEKFNDNNNETIDYDCFNDPNYVMFDEKGLLMSRFVINSFNNQNNKK